MGQMAWGILRSCMTTNFRTQEIWESVGGLEGGEGVPFEQAWPSRRAEGGGGRKGAAPFLPL